MFLQYLCFCSRNAEALFLSHLEDTDLIATLLNAGELELVHQYGAVHTVHL